jgi:regulation of enolase protein 1 (concanavalin A-like superfamily)
LHSALDSGTLLYAVPQNRNLKVPISMPQKISPLSLRSLVFRWLAFASAFASHSASAEQVIFTEIQYNPSGGNPEFIEITNNTATPFDMGRWYFSDGVDYTFPDFNPSNTSAHILKAFETILVVKVDEATLRTAYPGIPLATRVFGPYVGSLNNAGEKVTLNNKNGIIMTTIDYNDGGKWPAAADGTGHTLTRINPNLMDGDWRNWRSSIAPGGTPGVPTTGAAATPLLVISEVHFGIDGRVDWIELHAPGTSSVSATPFTLSSIKNLSNATALTGSVSAGAYRSFVVDFPVEANGDIDLFLASGTSIVYAVRLDRDLSEETFQSVPVGQEFFGGSGHTRDAPNNPSSRNTAVVINEIMYDAPSDQRDGEFVELYNRSGSAINLTGWKFSDGINFDFPLGSTIAANSYLVVAANKADMIAAYGAIPVIGNFTGTLKNGGELLRLEDNNGNLIDEVDYLPGGDWPNLADGDGSSMELRHPDMNNDVATAWGDSDESQKSTMQTFTYTDVFERSTYLPLTSGQELHTHLVGDSHVILENISIKRNNTGSNLIANPAIMSPDNFSSKGWVCQGTHWASFMDAGKLNLIADGHGDNKANRAEVDMATAPIVGDNYTLSFDGRWVSGKSRIIFQTLDHGYGTTFLLPVPANLGTPGAANSTSLTTAAPTVAGIIHSPAVPSAGNPVTVSARITSAATLTSVDVVHRLDNNTGSAAWLRTPMTNNGDGLYSAAISQYNTQGNIVQFYVEAKAGAASTFQPRFGPARPAMWIVDNRTMPSVLMRERFIISEYDQAALTTATGHSAAFGFNFPRPSNHFFNATFIANESEIFYNAEIRKSGSPFTRSDNANIDHGKWKLPGDRLFRGRHRNVIDASGTPEGSGTPRFYDDRIARYFLYQLGLPTSEMEYVHSVVNTLGFKLRENQEPIANDFMDRNFAGGADGTLLRIDDEWRFTSDDGNARSSRNADWSYKNSENPIRYHSEWIMRSRENDYDYGNFTEFVRTLDENTFDEATINRMADADMLCISAAVRGYDADWDTLTVDRGKNAYFFRPKEGKGWMLIHWDGDRVFERSGQAIIGGRTGIPTYFNKPYIKRRLNYYLTKLLDEHTKNSARTLAWMQAEEVAVAGSGVITSTAHYTNWFTIRESLARNFVTTAVNNTPFAVTTSNATTSNNTINLNGTAPPAVYAVRIAGQPHATFVWNDTRIWSLNGIVLQTGANILNVEGIDHDGNIVQQLQFNITKSSNAPPLVNFTSTPKSLNVSLTETLMLDASTSSDPDGSALMFTWQITPATGVNLTPVGATASASFTQAGAYQLSITATDAQLESTTRTIDLTAYDVNSFSTFGDPDIENFWNLFKVAKHGNASSDPYYTLQDNPGRLSINIPYSHTPLGLLPPTLPAPVQYIDFGDVWKYDDSNDELTGVFAQPAYDDSAWLSGPGFLGFNESGLPGPGMQTGTLRRDSANNLVTYYFRKAFQFTDDPIGAMLYIDHIVDDGVRYYLNGEILGKIRLPDGVIDSNTPATPLSPEDTIEEDVIIADVSTSLISGTNILAAEVHNAGAGSSDLVFGARVDIAALPAGTNIINLDNVNHPWIRRDLPAADWILQTEVKLERAQFGKFYAGLLVEAEQNGSALRYGVGFEDGNRIAAIRVNPSGSSTSLASMSASVSDIAIIRLKRVGDQLTFEWRNGDTFTVIHQVTLPAGTTFSVGGIFASTESIQSIEASFDYAILIDTTPASDFDAWMATNGFADPNAEFANTGLSNLLAYALGRDLSSQVAPAAGDSNGFATFSHRQRLAITSVNYQIESSTDLLTWAPATDLAANGAPDTNPDGTLTVNYLSNVATSSRPAIYYRLRVTAP